MIATLPTLCPNWNWIRLIGLPRDPIITAAISGLVLTAKHKTLRYFDVDSLLTEEACGVLFRNPDLYALQAFIDGSVTLPTMVLPSITDICIEYDHGHKWLQGFSGASLGKLSSVTIASDSESIDDFLGAFETVALATSIPATLSSFGFFTSLPWRPNYRSLLAFTQLKDIFIEFSCELGCSSTIDDDTITDLARAMPKLATLAIGGLPCDIPGGVTVKGLAALSRYCSNLYRLCIHFQVASLDLPGIPSLAPVDEPAVPLEGCPLQSLLPGDIHVPEASAPTVALTLLRIFPRLVDIQSSDMGWEKVSEALDRSKRVARCSSKKVYLLYLESHW